MVFVHTKDSFFMILWNLDTWNVDIKMSYNNYATTFIVLKGQQTFGHS